MCIIKGNKINLLVKRVFDFFLSFLLLLILTPFIIIIGILIKIDSKGPIFFWSKRYGKNKIFFYMPKFRSMAYNTPLVDTKNLQNSEDFVTKLGKFLRTTSIDEIPQLYSVLKGDMSLVGPRPALFTQNDLIQMRDKFSINFLKPGITGLAQINGRDNITLNKKVKFDKEYLNNRNFCLDLKILFITIYGLKWLKDISH